jgi:hypothetical protein
VRRVDLIALGVGMTLLALGPLALTLARSDSYEATAVVRIATADPATRYLDNPRGLLAGPIDNDGLQRVVARDVIWFNHPKDLPKYVRVSTEDAGTFAITARGPQPKEAVELADAAADRLRAAASSGANFTRLSLLSVTTNKLHDKGLSGAQRAKLEVRRHALAVSDRANHALFPPPITPAVPPSQRIGDRLATALPGDHTFRPDPVWVALAGVALAGALGLWALALGPRRSGSGSSTPG